MKYLPYILKHLRRNWIRTASTVVAMSVCIFLFCTLETLVAAISWNRWYAFGIFIRATAGLIGVVMPVAPGGRT